MILASFWSLLRMIFDNLSNPDPTKKDNAAGIQLLGIIAANGLSPISHNSTIDEERWVRKCYFCFLMTDSNQKTV